MHIGSRELNELRQLGLRRDSLITARIVVGVRLNLHSMIWVECTSNCLFFNPNERN